MASAPLPKFVIHGSTPGHELRKQRGTSDSMILVPLFDLKFLNEFAATAVGTSNRRHYLTPETWTQCNRNTPSTGRISAGLIRRQCATVTECSGPSSCSCQNARKRCSSGKFGQR